MDETTILERLEELSDRICSNTHFGKVAERVRNVQLAGLYQRAKALEAEMARNPDGSPPLSLVDRFAERLFPDVTYGGDRQGEKHPGRERSHADEHAHAEDKAT